METVPTAQSNNQTAEGATRRCLVTGVVLPQGSLVRFALDADGHVTPDLAGKLPGRGLWVSASRAVLTTAVRKNLFARAAKSKGVKVDPALPEQVADLLYRRCLDLIGLAKSAGATVVGQPQIEQSIKQNKQSIVFVLVASDAVASDGLKKLQKTDVVRGFHRADLARALGREDVVYVGFHPHRLASRLREEMKRLEGMSEDTITVDGLSDSGSINS